MMHLNMFDSNDEKIPKILFLFKYDYFFVISSSLC
jgi:hypothetical protein